MNCSSARHSAARLLTLASLLPLPAAATLGEGLNSVQADALRLAAVRRVVSGLGGSVHTLVLPDGSTIRQYLGADGRVYALAWNTRYKPRLDALLGTYFAAYAEGARWVQAQRSGPQHGAVINQGDLVVEAQAHLNAHVGRAWLRSRLPAGATPDALR